MTPREAMARAVELAARGRFRVEPNPTVGCVLVKRNRVVGEGWHRRWGGAHAEVAALRKAGAEARGATAYITLEPCAHHGKTPPCTDALIRAGVRRVVYAQRDPFPGEGPRLLRDAGIMVERVRPTTAAKALVRPYLAHLENKRPWIIAKWAMTLDGRIATRTGDSRWISSKASRRWAHATFRKGVDAIVVGAGTVRTDDPALTNRSGGKQPLRVVVCGRRPIPRRSQLMTDGRPTLLIAPQGFRAPRGAEVERCGTGWRIPVDRVLKRLHDRGLRRVLIEGGRDLLGSLFDKGLVDQVVVFCAPRIVGGIGAVPAVAGRGFATMNEAFELDEVAYDVRGGDQIIEGYVRH